VTAQRAEQPAPARKTPAKTLDDVVRIMTGDVDADFKQQFQDALKKAWAAARAECSLAPLNRLVENWWPIANRWSDPVAARAYYADLDRWVREGIRPEERADPDEVLAIFEAKGASGPALEKLRSLAARR